MFSLLIPTKVNKRRGKHKIIIIHIFTLRLLNKEFDIIKIKPSQIIFNIKEL
jgi:hypothetical protein